MKSLIFASILFLYSSASLAFHCPADAGAIDNGLSKATLSDDDRAAIVELRNTGMTLHESGDHQGAVNTLSEAMRMLLSKME